ncbi:MAG: penicillin-binding protein 2 [Coriobacteriia bacterium]|nr:penicillin-binding protein 2 [Coriobacteriia bacterium]
MSRNTKQANSAKQSRLFGLNSEMWVLSLFGVLIVFVLFGLVKHSVVDAKMLSDLSQDQRTSPPLPIPAKRGTIYDRNGSPLAMSVDATTIYVNPSEVIDPQKTALALQETLGGEVEDYLKIILKSESPTFAYVLHKGDVQLARDLQDKDDGFRKAFINELPQGSDIPANIPTALTGIHYLEDSKRVYPFGNIGAQAIGAVGMDGHGISGLELTYDSILCGVDGTIVVERGRYGTPMVGGVQEKTEPHDGQDIIISIDIEMQQCVESELAAMSKKRKCKNANTLLLDGDTGEILAAASIPLYNRENLKKKDVEAGATALKAITMAYEPGSTFKAATMAAALESKTLKPDDELFCPASLDIYDHTITDAHERSDTTMSLKTILAKSSNVGVSLVERRMTDKTFASYLDQYGFGKYTHVDYPGEAAAHIDEVKSWNPVQAANISFGQGVQTSSLQIASFYGAIANGGVLRQPHFLIARPQYDTPPVYDFEAIMPSSTAEDLEEMLGLAVTKGTGKAAAIEGYEVVGKTGTAEKASKDGGYIEDEYVVSFVGYFANSNSKIVCITSFDNPLGAWGNSPAPPLFKTLMTFAINRYMILPADEAVPSSLTAPAPSASEPSNPEPSVSAPSAPA